MASYAGLLLRAARQRAGVGLLEMAELTGQPSRYLSKIERGDSGRVVTSELVAAYERVLNVALAEAVDRLTGPGPVRPAERRPTAVCPLITVEGNAELAEPLWRLLEALNALTAHIAALLPTTPIHRNHQHVNGKVRIND